MKITKEIWEQGTLMEVKYFNDIPAAIENAAQSSVELAELVGRLVEVFLTSEYRTRSEALSHILGSGYQVAE